ncbi:PAS-domain containing protein [uncultured Maritimibacter sp.]|jgi:PAS domain-containing protein|uniref:PAS-domain containing protein n=1 Tax=uncultured Maritimibacter sp. TaxID=991866 RepID=UPI000A6DCC46|nr:PAS-domain containing protein [uncultured Maritimibacter sp.]
MTPILATLILCNALAVAVLCLVLIGWLGGRGSSDLYRLTTAEQDGLVFLFQDEVLLDASPSARSLIELGPGRGKDWFRVAFHLEPLFPSLQSWFSDLASLGEKERVSSDGSTILRAVWREGVARISLVPRSSALASPLPDRMTIAALSHEVEGLRSVADNTTIPMWRETSSGMVVWCNDAYLNLSEELEEASVRTWPPARLFDLPTAGKAEAPATRRKSILLPDSGDTRWFDIDIVAEPGGQLCIARAIDTLVRAEKSQQDFVATLSKTFATLPIGLAIFNRDHELTVFNPALLDLTGLRSDFLLARPTISAVFDRMREQRMMPEPKDYKSWRQHLSEITSMAQAGTFEETWTMPSGQTYSVTGLPHPDGAIAFQFADISDEMTMARDLRTELEVGEAVMNTLPAGLVVFSLSGRVVFVNAAYAALWPQEAETRTLQDCIAGWRKDCAPSGLWDALGTFVSETERRDAWSAPILRLDGRSMTLTVTPLPRGNTLVEFAPQTGVETRAPAQEHPAKRRRPSKAATAIR